MSEEESGGPKPSTPPSINVSNLQKAHQHLNAAMRLISDNPPVFPIQVVLGGVMQTEALLQCLLADILKNSPGIVVPGRGSMPFSPGGNA